MGAHTRMRLGIKQLGCVNSNGENYEIGKIISSNEHGSNGFRMCHEGPMQSSSSL